MNGWMNKWLGGWINWWVDGWVRRMLRETEYFVIYIMETFEKNVNQFVKLSHLWLFVEICPTIRTLLHSPMHFLIHPRTASFTHALPHSSTHSSVHQYLLRESWESLIRHAGPFIWSPTPGSTCGREPERARYPTPSGPLFRVLISLGTLTNEFLHPPKLLIGGCNDRERPIEWEAYWWDDARHNKHGSFFIIISIKVI